MCDVVSSISSMKDVKGRHRVYSIEGIREGDNLPSVQQKRLPKGIFVVDGNKVEPKGIQ